MTCGLFVFPGFFSPVFTLNNPMPVIPSLISNGLLYNVDLSDPLCWDATTAPETITPLRLGNDTNVKTLVLQDYGLTGMDSGESQFLDDIKTVETQKGMVLTALDFPNLGTGPYVTVATGTTMGRYATLTNSPFGGFFKLHNRDFEALPVRYGLGMTIETSVNVGAGTFGDNAPAKGSFIFYMGTRAENKFAVLQGDNAMYTTVDGIDLGPDHSKDVERGVEGNALGFFINKGGQIGFRRITDKLEVHEQVSVNKITRAGWITLSFSYTPCIPITDPDLLECSARREGILRLYVNGLLFHEFQEFEEAMFKALETEAEKQLGVPYHFSWGGGTRGLKTQFHWGEVIQGRSGLAPGPMFIPGPVPVLGPELLIEKHFDGVFNGSLQTLRIYNRPLNAFEVRQNHNFLAPRYGLPLIQGGRIAPVVVW